jgi:hypothetical protein
MSRFPDFDDLVGTETDGAERERMRRVHELLIAAGPPPELSPELEGGPDMLVTYRNRRRSRRWRRSALLAAAVLVLAAAAFSIGYISGNDSKPVASSFAAKRVVALKPTSEAANAWGQIAIGRRDPGGNWPMKLIASGLPRLSGNDYYAVILTKDGKVKGFCGSFVVDEGRASVYLNAPYKLDEGAEWIVTVQHPGERTPGPVVLRT